MEFTGNQIIYVTPDYTPNRAASFKIRIFPVGWPMRNKFRFSYYRFDCPTRAAINTININSNCDGRQRSFRSLFLELQLPADCNIVETQNRTLAGVNLSRVVFGAMSPQEVALRSRENQIPSSWLHALYIRNADDIFTVGCLFQCGVCTLIFDSEDIMIDHINGHMIYRCDACSAKFVFEEDLRDHRATFRHGSTTTERGDVLNCGVGNNTSVFRPLTPSISVRRSVRGRPSTPFYPLVGEGHRCGLPLRSVRRRSLTPYYPREIQGRTLSPQYRSVERRSLTSSHEAESHRLRPPLRSVRRRSLTPYYPRITEGDTSSPPYQSVERRTPRYSPVMEDRRSSPLRRSTRHRPLICYYPDRAAGRRSAAAHTSANRRSTTAHTSASLRSTPDSASRTSTPEHTSTSRTSTPVHTSASRTSTAEHTSTSRTSTSVHTSASRRSTPEHASTSRTSLNSDYSRRAEDQRSALPRVATGQRSSAHDPCTSADCRLTSRTLTAGTSTTVPVLMTAAEIDDRPFKCYHCGAAFIYKRNIALHMKIHLENSRRAKICASKGTIKKRRIFKRI